MQSGSDVECGELVSIITPAYNSSKYISQTIDSVQQQTYEKWELIIINDCSTDNTVEIVRRYQLIDNRIKLIELKANSGIAKARNVGIQKANGRYIAFLDSDDIWLCQKLERQISYMKAKEIAFCFTGYRQFRDDSEQYGKLNKAENEITYKMLLKGNRIPCLTVIIDREYIKDLTLTNQAHEDYILWLDILKRGFKAYGLNEDLARYRVSGTSTSGNKMKSAMWTWRVYRDQEKLSLFAALYNFSFYAIRGVFKHFFNIDLNQEIKWLE